MVDRITIQRTIPVRGFGLFASTQCTSPADEKPGKVACQSTELLPDKGELANGKIHFTDEAVEALVFASTAEVPGLAAAMDKSDLTPDRMIKKSRLRGIHVRLLEDRVQIGISITVKPGHRAVCVAKEIQDRVRNNVENMTGLTVANVNVYVAAIQIAEQTANLH